MLPIVGRFCFLPLSSQIACACQSNHSLHEEKDLTSGRITVSMSLLADVCLTWLLKAFRAGYSTAAYSTALLSILILCPSVSNSAVYDKISGNYFLPYKIESEHIAPSFLTVLFLHSQILIFSGHILFQFNHMNSLTGSSCR